MLIFPSQLLLRFLLFGLIVWSVLCLVPFNDRALLQLAENACDESVWDGIISQNLKPFQNGIQKVNVDKAEEKVLSGWGGFGGWRIIISGKKVYIRPSGLMKSHDVTHSVKRFFFNLVQKTPHDLHVEFIYHFLDGPIILEDEHLAIFGWAKRNQSRDILFPYPYSFANVDGTVTTIARNAVPWENKIPKAFFRGTTTGGVILTKENWMTIPRARLVQACHSMKELCDAEFTGIIQASDGIAAIVKNTLGLGERVPLFDQFKYKYLLLPDGNTAPSSRSVEYFHSGSLLIKPRTNTSEFFYDLFKPGVHYVEVAPDFSDLREKLLWLRDHDAEARKMAEATTSLARRHVTEAGSLCYASALLRRYQALMRFTPNITEEMQAHAYGVGQHSGRRTALRAH